MAGVYKKGENAKKWTCWWIDEKGEKRSKVGTPNRAESLEIARRLEHAALLVRRGLVDPTDHRRAEHAARPIAEHLEHYRLDLVARESDPKHVVNTISAIRRLCASVGIDFAGDLTVDKIRAGAGGIKAKRSARTANHALGAVKSFVRWLVDSGRLKEDPTGLRGIKPYPEDSDRRRVRRPLLIADLDRLLRATERGPVFVTHWTSRHGEPVDSMTGLDRAMAYRVACATGFRADEIRTLTPERFSLGGDSPTITVQACYSKRGKRSGRDDIQPIAKPLAALLRVYLEGRPPNDAVWPLPGDRLSKMLRADLAAAEIPYEDAKGRVVDFHAMRHTYITWLVKSGVDPKTAQMLARHSDIRLTLDRYTTSEDSDLRDAVDKLPAPPPSDPPDGGTTNGPETGDEIR